MTREIAQVCSIAFFAWYGLTCFFSKKMIAEFTRYRVPQLRILTGSLQLAASLGLATGFVYRPALLLSSGGLAAMMFVAVITRFNIRDPLYLTIPAFSLFLLNLYIFIAAV